MFSLVFNMLICYMIQEYANLIEVVMAAISIVFVIPAALLAYSLRNNISKTLFVMAVSKNLYKYLFMILGFSVAITISHLFAHLVEYFPVSVETDFLIHISIDSMLILVAISLYMTFKQAYGMMQEGSPSAKEIENKLRQSAMKIPSAARAEEDEKEK